MKYGSDCRPEGHFCVGHFTFFCRRLVKMSAANGKRLICYFPRWLPRGPKFAG
jgi:hypothetical protein